MMTMRAAELQDKFIKDAKNNSGGYRHLIMFRITNYLDNFSRMNTVNLPNAWLTKFALYNKSTVGEIRCPTMHCTQLDLQFQV